MKTVLLTLNLLLFSLTACKNTATTKNSTTSTKDKIKLQLHFEKGDKYNLVMTVKQKIEQLFEATPNYTKQNIATSFLMEAIDKKEGIISMKNTYGWNVYEIEMMGRSLTYDSRKENEDNPLTQAMDALTGKSFVMKFTEDGNINSIEGTDKIIDAVVNNMTNVSGQQKAAMREQMEQQFGEEAMMKNMAQMFFQYPKKLLKIGDSWKQNMDITSSFPMRTETVYTLKSIDKTNNLATLAINGTIRSKEGAQITSSGIAMDVEFEGTQKGETSVNISNGMANLAKLQQDIKGSLKVMEQIVPMTITSDIEIKAIE